MSEKKNILDHLKPKKVEVPDASYFQQMAEGIVADQKPATKIIPLYKKPVVWFTAVAAAIIIAFVLQFSTDPSQDQNILLALNDIPREDIQAYVDDNIEEFDTELIAEYIDEDEISEEELLPIEMEDDNTIAVSEPIHLDNIEEEEILEYFKEEEIDLIDLLEDESFI